MYQHLLSQGARPCICIQTTLGFMSGSRGSCIWRLSLYFWPCTTALHCCHSESLQHRQASVPAACNTSDTCIAAPTEDSTSHSVSFGILVKTSLHGNNITPAGEHNGLEAVPESAGQGRGLRYSHCHPKSHWLPPAQRLHSQPRHLRCI
jgi:hypothetical protein